MGLRSLGYGPAGPRGEDGESIVGPPGPAGPQGVPGQKGDTGSIGPQGVQGIKGDTGSVGSTGPTGPAGVAGPQGPKGDTGAIGVAGPAGVKGDTGLTGSTGPAGPTGPSGATGAVGPTGPQGATGPAGASFNVTAPVVTSLTTAQKNGTAFQPRAGGPCMVNITGSMSGVLNVMSAITVATSPTANGAYTNVGTFTLFVGVAGPGVTDSGTGSFLVPTGHFVKVTQTGVSILANILMNSIVWNL